MARSALQNVKRRGAVYWWRRTISLPSLAVSEKFPISFEFSLFTRELDSARGRAAALTAYSERLKMSFRENVALHGMTEQNIAAIYVDEVRSYRNELVHLEAAWKQHPDWSRVSDRKTDLSIFETLWTAIADQGLGVPRDWSFVEQHFEAFDEEIRDNIRSLLRHCRDIPESLRRSAYERLEAIGVGGNSVNIPVSVNIIARARAEAARQVRDNIGLSDLATFASMATKVSGRAADPIAPRPSHSPPAPTQRQTLAARLTSEQQNYAAMSPTEFVEVFIKDEFGGLEHRHGEKRLKQIVGDSTYRDVRWICLLLEKSLPEKTPLADVTINDLITLDSWFDRLPTTIGKSPADKLPETTFEMIEERAIERISAGELDADQIGLGSNTTNKHWHNLARIHTHLRTLVPTVDTISIKKFLTPDDRDQRKARDQLTTEQGRAIFSLPPWTGCAGLKKRLEAGDEIIHDALYFVLLLVWYTGARREEICKLMVNDIFCDVEVPYIYIGTTLTGRLKTANATRKIPIHSELLRLGFSEFCRSMKDAKEVLLFAEIYPSAGTKRAVGDVFYKIWWIYLKPYIPNLLRGQAMHSARYTVSDALKDAGVAIEQRNDILGQSQKELGERASRYSQQTALIKMRDMVELIPTVTDHLPNFLVPNILPKKCGLHDRLVIFD